MPFLLLTKTTNKNIILSIILLFTLSTRAVAFLASSVPIARTTSSIPSSFIDCNSFLRSSSSSAATTTNNNNNNNNNGNMSSSSSSDTTGEISTNNQNNLPRIDRSEVVGSTKWLRLETLTYTDIANKERKWDYATRTTKKSKDSADAVVIIPLLKRPYKNDNDNSDNDNSDNDNDDPTFDTLLVEQFRPPVGKSTLEFPAGLIDAGETPEQAALRELKEETGYVGEACKVAPTVSPLVCMSPGLCDETVRCVVVVVDLDNPYNDPNGALFEATPDEGEHIRVHRVSLKDGFRKLLDQGEEAGSRSALSSPMAIQGLYLFAMGLEIGKTIKSSKP